MISILIVEDQLEHQLYLKTVLGSDSDFKNVGVIRLGSEAIKEICKLRPDIVLMDLDLPDMSGIECMVRVKDKVPNTMFMVCTVLEDDESIFAAIKAGAHGYLVKRSKPYQILDALREMHAGEMPLSSCIARKILNSLHKEEDTAAVQQAEFKITPRENDILQLLSKGYSYQEIADQAFISIKTMKWHIHNIYKKLHANNRTEALNTYFKHT